MEYSEALGIVKQIISRHFRAFERMEEVLSVAADAESVVAASQERVRAASEEVGRLSSEQSRLLAQMTEEKARHVGALAEMENEHSRRQSQLEEETRTLSAAAEAAKVSLREAEQACVTHAHKMEEEFGAKKGALADEVAVLERRRDDLRSELAELIAKFRS